MGEQHGHGCVFDHVMGDAPHDQLAQATMGIGAHHQQPGAEFLGFGRQGFAGILRGQYDVAGFDAVPPQIIADQFDTGIVVLPPA
jgi:hypothetical protein